MRLSFTIQRFNPETDQHPHQEDYRLDIGRGMTVLKALIRIKNELDGSLSLRYSCRSAICGSCAMRINGTEKLSCRTSIRKEFERHGRISIDPLPNLPLIKDLVVDMSPFWDKIRAVTPWLTAVTHPTKRYGASGQLRLLPDTYQFHNVDACIMCGACVAACTSHEVRRVFLAPRRSQKRNGSSQIRESRPAPSRRDSPPSRRPMACGIDPLQHVRPSLPQRCSADGGDHSVAARGAPAWLDLNQGARHITGFTNLVRREGRLNEALMPLKVVGVDIRRLLNVMPLGVRMWLKGKVPSPFGHTIPGIEQVRAIFAAARRLARRA